jgi:hypothetical protein
MKLKLLLQRDGTNTSVIKYLQDSRPDAKGELSVYVE